MGKLKALLFIFALLLAAFITPVAYYSSVGAHEALHCLWQTAGDICDVRILRPPAIEDGGVIGSTGVDHASSLWLHSVIYFIGYLVAAVFYVPSIVLAYLSGDRLK